MLELTTPNTIHAVDGDRASLNIGERVVLECDALVELARQSAGLPPTWFCLPAGARGTLLGWRDRPDDTRAIVELERGPRELRLLVFVRAERLVRVPRRQRASCGSRSVR